MFDDMFASLSPVSDEKLEFDSSSSDFCRAGSPCKDESPSSASEAYNACSLCEHSQEVPPLYVQKYPLTVAPNGENDVDATLGSVVDVSLPNGGSHVDPTLTSVVDTSVQNSEECAHVCGQHAEHSGRATHTSFVSNSHVHIGGSFSGATSIPMGGPSTGVMSICGMRSEMEDAVTIAHKFLLLSCKQIGGCSETCLDEQGANTPLHFFGVYDGHGGSQVSNFCKDRLHITLANEFQSCNDGDQNDSSSTRLPWEKYWEKAMFSTFHKMDAEIEGFTWRGAHEGNGSVRERVSEPLAPETVGSTAVVAVVGSCQIIIANCGDSRAVLSRGGQAIALSVDHKPNREDEMERIEAAGGRVICWNGYRVFGVLAMSRAIGDRYLKPYVISEPEVKCISRTEDDDCLILASDGLWDVLTNQEVCEVARRCLTRRAAASDGSRSPGFTMGSNDKNAEAAAALLTKMALAQGSHDNISVVVVDLKDRSRN